MFPLGMRPIVGPVVTVKWIVAAAAEAEAKPANESSPTVTGVKIIAETIVVAARIYEQRPQKTIVVDHIARVVRPMRPQRQVQIDGHRREQQPALA